MASPQIEDINTLDWVYNGLPNCDFLINYINIDSLDWVYNGLPNCDGITTFFNPIILIL